MDFVKRVFVEITTSFGILIIVDVSPYTCFAEIKKRIEDTLKIPAMKQQLFHRGIKMSNIQILRNVPGFRKTSRLQLRFTENEAEIAESVNNLVDELHANFSSASEASYSNEQPLSIARRQEPKQIEDYFFHTAVFIPVFYPKHLDLDEARSTMDDFLYNK